MASSALKAHLHTSQKIVNDSHTFLLRDFPDLCCDCCLQFTNCLRIVLIHIILEIPTQINITDLFREENPKSYQTYLKRKICRATRLIWRGKSAELPGLFGDENLENYNKLRRENSGHRLVSINCSI
jgi:hypothetical protein